jgi:hypothetical protein
VLYQLSYVGGGAPSVAAALRYLRWPWGGVVGSVGVVVAVVVDESGEAGRVTVSAGGTGVGAVAGGGAGSVGLGAGAGDVRDRVCPVVGAVADQAESRSFTESEVELAAGAPRSVPPSVLRVGVGVGAGSVAGTGGVTVRPSAGMGCVTDGAGSGVRAGGSGEETGGETGAGAVPTVASGVFLGA